LEIDYIILISRDEINQLENLIFPDLPSRVAKSYVMKEDFNPLDGHIQWILWDTRDRKILSMLTSSSLCDTKNSGVVGIDHFL